MEGQPIGSIPAQVTNVASSVGRAAGNVLEDLDGFLIETNDGFFIDLGGLTGLPPSETTYVSNTIPQAEIDGGTTPGGANFRNAAISNSPIGAGAQPPTVSLDSISIPEVDIQSGEEPFVV